MEETLDFPVLLRLIDERSIAFRAAVMSAPGLEIQVPTCPEWTLLDLAQHLGGVHRFWAAAVNAGSASAPPAESASESAGTAPREREPLLAWSAASTRQLLDALREAGPNRSCWTWWGPGDSWAGLACSRPPKPYGQIRGETLDLWYGGPDISDDQVLACEPIPLARLQS